jgi:hypothetical protein
MPYLQCSVSQVVVFDDLLYAIKPLLVQLHVLVESQHAGPSPDSRNVLFPIPAAAYI